MFYSLTGIGITMACLLPLLPFVMSIGAILGWLMAVFTAVVAMPVWVAGHLHPDGEGLSGQHARSGYMILLETLTRPVFIVLGLLGAFLIMDPILKFVAWAFQANMGSIMTGFWASVVGMFVFAIAYVMLTFTVVRQTTALSFELSKSIYTWIGGQFAGYDTSGQFAGAAQSNMGAVQEATARGEEVLKAFRRTSASGNGKKLVNKKASPSQSADSDKEKSNPK